MCLSEMVGARARLSVLAESNNSISKINTSHLALPQLLLGSWEKGAKWES